MDDITPDLLLRAYSVGVFPMAEGRDDPDLFWVEPKQRGILPLDAVHIPRRLKRTIRADHFEMRVDTAFEDVMKGCASVAAGRADTWINDRILELYAALHAQGHAHSVECWRDGRLVGGVYGVRLGAAFFGESMFSLESNASKVALMHLVARLSCGGFDLLDTQFVTDHLCRFGAIEIPAADYRKRLDRAIMREASFYRIGETVSGEAALQFITQTS